MIKLLFITLLLAKGFTDSAYFAELETKAAKLPQPRKDLVLNYIEYLKTGKNEKADAYIQTLKKNSPPKIQFAIFEGDFDLCHIEKGSCVRSIGELTTAYLLPKLKKGDKKALELLNTHIANTVSDGADAESLQHILSKLKK